MLEAFREHIRKKDWGTAHQRLLVAVSGGLDSMVLLHLLQQAGCPMGVGHVNFQLRGAAADEDERFVRETCEQRKIPFHSTRVDTNNYAIHQGVSVQVAARELRYQWLVEVARREGYTHIVTAHQANDNLETVLLNWIHGKGWDGWLGIPEQNELIIRPLLPFSREQLLTYAASEGITWREDESNLRDDYQRNAVRHHVVPELLKINPSLMDTFQRGLAKTKALPFLIKAGLAAAGQEGIAVVGSEMRIGKRWLTGQPEPVSVLYELMRGHGFTLSQVQQLTDARDHVGARFLTHTHVAVVDRGAILVGPLSDSPGEALIDQGETVARLGSQQLHFFVEPPAVDADAATACLDLDCLSFPLTWRGWREGDVLQPIGMTGTRKVSDMLIDAKVPRSHKPEVTVLESGGRVVWLVGHRLAEWARITPNTRQMLRVQWSREMVE